MKISKTLLFTVVVLGLVAYVYLVEIKKHGADEERKDKDSLIFNYTDDKVNHIDLKNATGMTQLEKKASHWFVTQPVEDAADDLEVQSFLNFALHEKTLDTVVEAADINWATYGLDKPAQDLIMKTTDGASLEMRVGAVKTFDSNLYARLAEQAKVLTIKGTWSSELEKSSKSFRRSQLLANASATFQHLQIIGSKPEIEMQKIKGADGVGTWAFAGASKDRKSFKVSEDAISKFAESIKSLKASEFVSESKTPAGLKKYALSSPSLTIRLQSEASAKADPVVWELKISAPKSSADTNFYAVSSDTKGIVQVPKAQVDALRKTPEDFYDRSAPFQYQVSQAASVQVRTASTTFEVKKQGSEWVSGDTASKQKVDQAKLEGLLNQLSQLQAQKFMPMSSAKGLSPAKNQILVYNEKAEPLLALKWGESFSEGPAKKTQADPTPMRYYFVSTQKSDQALAVSAGAVDGLPIGSIFIVNPPAPTPAKAAPSPAKAKKE
jgi:hypothetical protein